MPRSERSLVAALFVVGALTAGLLAAPASAAPAARTGALAAASSAAEGAGETEPSAVLARAKDIFSSKAANRSSAGSSAPAPAPAPAPDASLALRDLFTVLPRLQGGDRETAQALLARPSDGGSDPQRNGYTAAAQRTCSKRICVHYVTSTSDAPPSLAWVKKSLRTMQKVYDFEVGKLGYRAPAQEPNTTGTGGNAKFDVYLKNIGTGIYGYCAPEYLKPGTNRVASGYCVLDNDFARNEFGGAKPATSLKVTAAHEFFHAIQFAYDYLEDPWLMESTAAWMEERYADSADDNLQYLERSQVTLPAMSLDFFESNGIYHYGQWAFWQFLSETHGNGIVRSVINRAAEPSRGKNLSSTQALSATLKKRGGLPKNFAAYAAANTTPSRNYAEGRKWPSSQLATTRTLTRGKPSFRKAFRVDHLASASVRLRPSGTLKGGAWKLRVAIDGPNRSNSPAAYVTVVTKRSGLRRIPITLSKRGKGTTRVPFAASSVNQVFVTVANASTRTTCNRGTTFACKGKPRDDDRRFSLQVKAVK
ncbi:hypothetical protein GCM10027020_18890 [Nocardioides salsibiostraticola]